MGIYFDLLSELVDENTKVLDLVTVVCAPHCLQQPAVRNNLTSMGNQVPQQIDFFRSQVLLPASTRDLIRLKIDGHTVQD